MKGLSILIIIAAGVLAAGALQADIYEWTDENGVKHFTNYAPPDNATILIKTEEFPYDEAADRARVEADKQFQLELTRLELAEREAELERREAEAVRRAAEAERYADDTVRAADNTWRIPAMIAGTIVVAVPGAATLPPVTAVHFTVMKLPAFTG